AAMIGLLVPEIPPVDSLIPISIRQVEWLERLQSACEQNDPDSIRRCCEHLLKPDIVSEQQFLSSK
ncbi:MAG TPA: hypothetical protein VLA12_08745, partial [Planctomycetaceae bacterium]|nr:hypothetical protein [Planctomycetaceae bacterium]